MEDIIKRKFSVSLIITFLFFFGIITGKTLAVSEFTNVSITPEGIISWNAVDEANLYWIGIDHGYVPSEDIESNIASRIGSTAVVKEVNITANKDGVKIAEWKGLVKYDGTIYTIPQFWTVKFIGNNNSLHKEKIVLDGAKVEQPEDPCETSCTFMGWYKDSNLKNKFDFNTKITKDTILYARWNNIYYEQFTDVSSESWYHNAVKYVYENNIIKGYNVYTFGPKDKITRGMVVTIIYRMEGEPKIDSNTPTFLDVQDSSKYYYKAIRWAAANKIVNGYNDGRFGPTDYIQRQDLAVILNSYAKYCGKDVSKTSDLKGFKDAKAVSSYAVNQMKWAVGTGVITGNDNKKTGERTLDPRGSTTRAEAAAMMEKYCKKIGR